LLNSTVEDNPQLRLKISIVVVLRQQGAQPLAKSERYAPRREIASEMLILYRRCYDELQRNALIRCRDGLSPDHCNLEKTSAARTRRGRW